MSVASDIKQCMQWIEAHVPDALAEDQQYTEVNKAGIVPLYGDEQVYVLLIKPHAKKKHLGDPPWQLIKGTRMVETAKGWIDYARENNVNPKKLEPLLCTALREGMEEAGLQLDNISGIGGLGEHRYTSLSNGKEKVMHLYALLVKDKDAFDWPDKKHPVTDSMKWFNINSLPDDIRPDVALVTSVFEGNLAGL